MTYGFFWSERSESRNQLTARYEPIQPLLLLAFAERTGATAFVDVGANVGLYALLMTRLPAIERVEAFEASEEACREIEKNIAMNDLGDRIGCTNKAVSATSGRIGFAIETPLSGINGVAATSVHDPRLFKELRDLECCALDDVIDVAGRPLAIKIDVEGHEQKVLEGARRLLAGSRSIVQVEAIGSRRDEVTAFLEGLGYRRLFGADNDLYFSNDDALATPEAVVKVLEATVARMIDVGLGRWPKVSVRMTVEAAVRDGVVSATCRPDGTVFRGELEFAFYVDVEGRRLHASAYTPSPSLEYPLPDGETGRKVAVSGFVRERAMPEKKVRVIAHVQAGS